MNNLKAAYINELFKLYKKKKIYVAAILSAVSVAIGALISFLIKSFMGISALGGTNFPILVLPVLLNTLVSLFVVFICVDMFSGEFSANTIKFTLTTPVSRFKIFTSKVLAAVSFIFANLMLIMVLSLIASLFLPVSGGSILYVFSAYLVSVLPLTAFALMVILISNLTKGTTSAFMTSVILFLLFRGLELVFPAYSAVFFTSSYDWYTYFAAIGGYVNYGKILRLFLVQTGYITVFFTLGYTIFDKKQI